MSANAELQAYLVGIMVFLAIFLALECAQFMPTPQARRAGAVFGAASGYLVALKLLDDPVLLAQITRKETLAALTVLGALFVALRRVW